MRRLKSEQESLLARVGLCTCCLHTRLIRSDRGSVFYFCGKSRDDQRFPKYPPLPVVECDGWEMTTMEEEQQEVEDR